MVRSTERNPLTRKVVKYLLSWLIQKKYTHVLEWTNREILEFSVLYIHRKSNGWNLRYLDMFKALDRISEKKFAKYLKSKEYEKECKKRCHSNMQKLCNDDILQFQKKEKIGTSAYKFYYKFLKYPSSLEVNNEVLNILSDNNPPTQMLDVSGMVYEAGYLSQRGNNTDFNFGENNPPTQMLDALEMTNEAGNFTHRGNNTDFVYGDNNPPTQMLDVLGMAYEAGNIPHRGNNTNFVFGDNNSPTQIVDDELGSVSEAGNLSKKENRNPQMVEKYYLVCEDRTIYEIFPPEVKKMDPIIPNLPLQNLQGSCMDCNNDEDGVVYNLPDNEESFDFNNMIYSKELETLDQTNDYNINNESDAPGNNFENLLMKDEDPYLNVYSVQSPISI